MRRKVTPIMIDDLSFVFPCDRDRVPLLLKTLDKYKQFGNLDGAEFIIPTRTLETKDVNISSIHIRVIPYSWNAEFNPSMALNIGVKAASFENVIIGSPEVIPLSDVVGELRKLERGNYVCQVYDINEKDERTISLVNKQMRGENPGMYFLALFRKEDILAINGWDEDFMGGCGWEDNDFGERFVRSGAKFEILEYIQAEHQYHQRIYLNLLRNKAICEKNRAEGIAKCRNGIVKY